MMAARSAFLLLLIGIATPALAQSGVSALKGHNRNAPVDVAADRIELQDRANRAIFSGNVKVRQGDMAIDAARMTVLYASVGGDPQVQRIDATGGVTVTSPSETARGNLGIYDLNRRLITLLGRVTLTSGGSSINGGRLLIDLNSGRATVDGNALGSGGSGSGGRVTGRFTVPQRNN